MKEVMYTATDRRKVHRFPFVALTALLLVPIHFVVKAGDMDLGVWLFLGLWYLICFNWLRLAIRDYRLGTFTTIAITNEKIIETNLSYIIDPKPNRIPIDTIKSISVTRDPEIGLLLDTEDGLEGLAFAPEFDVDRFLEAVREINPDIRIDNSD